MYYQSYEDYMRDVLGYPQENQYSTYNYNMQKQVRSGNEEVERLYPEIYRIVYPMVRKACTQCNGEITEEFIERLTNEVCDNFETEQNVRSEQTKTTSKTQIKTETRKEEETRQRRPNNNIRDLIKILIIRELLSSPNRPGRPPFPGIPRPPFPGGPGQGPRPPIRTSTTIHKRCRHDGLYGNNIKLYTL